MLKTYSYRYTVTKSKVLLNLDLVMLMVVSVMLIAGSVIRALPTRDRIRELLCF
jgi:hypothetical protein